MWNERYSVEGYVYGVKPNDFLKDNFQLLIPNGKVLTLSEGEGRNAVFLSKKGFIVHAIDSSSVAIEKALSLARDRKVAFEYDLISLEGFDYSIEKWDGVISIFAHTNKESQTLIFNNVKKCLKVGGVFILEGYNEKQLLNDTGGPKSADMMFDLEFINSMFEGFEILISQNISREIHEGDFHNGQSDVIQFVCKKIVSSKN